MKTILAPIDFSDISDAVVREAEGLARGLNGRLVLLNVIQPALPLATDYLSPAVVQSAVEMTDAAEKSAARKLARIARKVEAEAVPVEAVHEIGDPVTVVLAKAESLPADFVVVGSHGHSALFDLVAGSVAHGVLRKAKCPVIVVPAQKTVAPVKHRSTAKAAAVS